MRTIYFPFFTLLLVGGLGGMYWYYKKTQDCETINTNYNIIQQKCKLAAKFLKMFVKENKNKLAVVFDIDDTCLFTCPNPNTNYKLRSSLTDKVRIEPVYKLYSLCKQLALSIFFVTARVNSAKNISYTIKELNSLGFDVWEGLVLRPPQQLPGDFKFEVRRFLSEKKGMTIVMNIGDRISDFKNGYAILEIKLPNICDSF